MSRPSFEVADVIRIAGDSFRERYSASLTWPQQKVLDAIARCRTARLGGHRDACLNCGHQAISYNSCRNRHWPQVSDRCARPLASEAPAGTKLPVGLLSSRLQRST